MFHEYPKWRYHAIEKPFIVRDPAHEDAAAHTDDGWVDHPWQLAAEAPKPLSAPAPLNPPAKKGKK